MRYLLLEAGLLSLLWAQSLESSPSLFFLQEGGRYFIVLNGEPNLSDRIEILDLTGKRIYTLTFSSESDKRHALPDMPEGLYYVRWITEEGKVRVVRRLIVSR